jgi:uncharacterized protein
MRRDRKTPERDTVVLVFARAPVPGRCKTRLIPALGASGAARLHRRLIERSLALAMTARMPVQLWCAPDCRHGFLQRCRRRHAAALRRQVPGDLGRKMSQAIGAALAGGWRKALLIGTDSATLSPADLTAACAALDHADCVLQPAEDGGYVLIGARRQWSSGRELHQSLGRLHRQNLSTALMPPRWDIDRPGDLRRARRAGLV